MPLTVVVQEFAENWMDDAGIEQVFELALGLGASSVDDVLTTFGLVRVKAGCYEEAGIDTGEKAVAVLLGGHVGLHDLHSFVVDILLFKAVFRGLGGDLKADVLPLFEDVRDQVACLFAAGGCDEQEVVFRVDGHVAVFSLPIFARRLDGRGRRAVR